MFDIFQNVTKETETTVTVTDSASCFASLATRPLLGATEASSKVSFSQKYSKSVSFFPCCSDKENFKNFIHSKVMCHVIVQNETVQYIRKQEHINLQGFPECSCLLMFSFIFLQGSCKEKETATSGEKKKKKKEDSVKNKGISNNRRLSIDPDVEIIIKENGKNDTEQNNKTELKRRKQLFTFSDMARKQNQIFIVAEVICTAVFDIVYALVSR